MPARDLTLYYWHADLGVAPDAADSPWALQDTSSIPPTDDSPRSVVLNAASGNQYYEHELVDSEAGGSGVLRGLDTFRLQTEIQVLTEASGRLLIFMDDRVRSVGVRLDKQAGAFRWETQSGTLIRTIPLSWPHLARVVVMLVKRAKSVWELWVDGQRIDQLPYEMAEASTAARSTAGVGWIGCTTLSEAAIGWLELSCNQALPHEWRYQRTLTRLPALVQDRLNDRHRAVVRSMVGLFEEGLEALATYQDQRNALILSLEPAAEAHGDKLPSAVDDRFTEGGATAIAREYLEIGDTSLSRLVCDMDEDMPSGGALAASASLKVAPGFTADAEGRICQIRLSDQDKRCGATLYQVSAGRYAWTLDADTDAPTGATAMDRVGMDPFHVDPHQLHRVSVVSLVGDVLLLIVDGAIVSRADYADLSLPPAVGVQATFRVARDASGVTFAARDIKVEAWRADLGNRAAMLRWLDQHNVPTGGCERSDEMELVQRTRSGQMKLRGTTHGVLVELTRLACEFEQVAVVEEQEQLGWWLNVSFPVATPVYLNVDGQLIRIFAEFPLTNLVNFTYQALADWMARHLLPLSTLEMQYAAALVSYMTAGSSVVGGNTRLTVGDTTGFEAGDAVSVRTADNSTYETTTVVDVVSSTQIDLTQTTATWSGGDVLRKTLATT